MLPVGRPSRDHGMRIPPHELALGLLSGRWDEEDGVPSPEIKAQQYQFLRDLTGEDFGNDWNAWQRWFDECPPDLLSEFYDNHQNVVQSKDHPDFPKRVDGANRQWANVTDRQCPECTALCPEYRRTCVACGFEIGRGRTGT